MARSLSTAAKTALFSADTTVVLPILIEISHTYEGASSPIYLACNNETITYDGHDYLPFAFKFSLPAETRDGLSNARLTIDAVDQSIIEVIREITVAPVVTVRAMLCPTEGGDPEELVPWRFVLRNVTFDANTISGELIYEDLLVNQMGPLEFTAEVAPGVN